MQIKKNMHSPQVGKITERRVGEKKEKNIKIHPALFPNVSVRLDQDLHSYTGQTLSRSCIHSETSQNPKLSSDKGKFKG